MSNGWSGPDPAAFTDAATDYELSTKYRANADVTINSVRVWGGPSSVAFVARKARIWSAGGVQQGLATLPSQLLPGWNSYPLDVPVSVPTGTEVWVSYSVQDTYGAATGLAYPRGSSDGLVSAQIAGLNSIPGAFPDTLSNTVFYGIDIDYAPGLGAGNQRPAVGIAVAATAYLTASATLTISDDVPAGVGYVIEWGDGASASVATLGPHAHTYATAGTYPVLVTATDAGGLTDSAVAIVTVVAAPGVFQPNSELVAQAWLATIPGIASGMVSTNLPRDNSTWAASGFVQVVGIVGGTPDPNGGRRNPVASLDLWANTGGSVLPPWGKASRLGELIMAACFDEGAGHVPLNLGTKYAPARVMSATALTEPRRIPGDKSGYARYQMDVQLSWAPV